ncbi:hypothetical protein SARC_03896 [Sphaeroforma arctica JP610]|uniref:Uncharacterized protein n=1 Tax=Sphaeroforma arctica JP610 TaxID=667725 RepID=A0A0L0G4X0_9EUKA|nr:hypothetical protein SARC_03896 [Sphaeroforma arctica JP610]KNC83871.1 hypothetical protein SARC_03896 [Sphaeroforma arctica JP610]|eukprot:XP_014157773.1 hypothetical protein SARC_03896 [Sphaeroforma arctica JP610]
MYVPQGEGGYSDNDPIVDDFDDFVPPSSGPWNSVAVQNRTVTDTMPMSGLTKGDKLHYICLYAENCYNGTDVTFDKLDKDFENLEPGLNAIVRLYFVDSPDWNKTPSWATTLERPQHDGNGIGTV